MKKFFYYTAAFQIFTALLILGQSRGYFLREDTLNNILVFPFSHDSFKIPESTSVGHRLITDDSSILMLRQKLRLQFSPERDLFSHDALKTNIFLPLSRRYSSQKATPFKYILGVTQAVAAGYLAYSHIKKYGFFGPPEKKQAPENQKPLQIESRK